jgi:glutamine synthetase
LGQYEIDLADMGALDAADALVTLKWSLRVLARDAGLLATFMPKPISGASGSGLHFHQRLIDRHTGANAFVDPADPYQLSPTARHFMAGQLAHAAGLCAVVAPLVNSYKRLIGLLEAPSAASWANTSRGALIRIPALNDRWGTRVELRAPDPSCNPYLALAAMLETGLDGLREHLPLPMPSEQPLIDSGQDSGPSDVPPLPRNLGEALEALEWDPVVRGALGQHIYELLLANQEREWDGYRQQISPWELDRYLEY